MQGGEQKPKGRWRESEEMSGKGLARQLELGAAPRGMGRSGSSRREGTGSVCSVWSGWLRCGDTAEGHRAEVRGRWDEVKGDAYAQEVFAR